MKVGVAIRNGSGNCHLILYQNHEMEKQFGLEKEKRNSIRSFGRIEESEVLKM